MSIFRTYHTARTAMAAQSAALNTAGQNVNNVGVEGYSRRRLTMATLAQPNQGLWSRPQGMGLAAGVAVESITRMRDELLVNAARDARSGLGGADEGHRGLTALESLLGTTSGSALTDVLSDFWDGFAALSDAPTDLGVRRSALGRANALADTLHRMDGDITALATRTQDDLTAGLDDANKLLDGIGAANAAVRRARAAGVPDLEAEDRRDALVDQLSELAGVRVHQDKNNGDYTVTLEGHALVAGDVVTHLGLDAPKGGTPALVLDGTTVAVRTEDGRLGARLSMLTTVLPGARGTLDAFASDLVTAFNAQHAQGDDLNGTPGADFFDPTGTTAASLRVALTDPAALAAAASGQPPGDSSNALGLVGLRGTFEKQAIDFLSGIGQQVQTAEGEAFRLDTVTRHLEALEKGVSGVSLDEEMTRLIEHQQAYQAAARVMSTAQSMMDTLLGL